MQQSVIVKEDLRNPEISIQDYKDLFSPLPLEQMFSSSFEDGTQKPAEFDVSVIIQDRRDHSMDKLIRESTVPNSLVIDTPTQKVHKVYRNSSYDTPTRSRLSQLVTELDQLSDQEEDEQEVVKKLKLNDSYQSLKELPHYSFHFAHHKSSSVELVQVASDDLATSSMKESASTASFVIRDDESVKDVSTSTGSTMPQPSDFVSEQPGQVAIPVEAQPQPPISSQKDSGTNSYATALQQQDFVSSMKVEELEQEVTDSMQTNDDTLSTQQLLAYRPPKNKVPSPVLNQSVVEDLPRCVTDEFDLEFNKELSAFMSVSRSDDTSRVQTPYSPSRKLILDPFEEQSEYVPMRKSPLKIPRRESIPEPTIRRLQLIESPITSSDQAQVPLGVQKLRLNTLSKQDIRPLCQQFRNLVVLELPKGSLTSLDPFLYLTSLRHFYVKDNQIKNVDSFVSSCKLQTFDISGNQINSLQVHSQSLENLTLSNNPLARLSIEAPVLIKLLAINCNIKSMMLRNCIKLQTLQISKARLNIDSISKLHEALSHMPQLTQLMLSDCQLAIVPPSVRSLSLLTSLDLSCNLISNLRTLKFVSSELQSLNLANNQLVDLAHTIHYVAKLKLKQLSLYGNRFSGKFTLLNGLAQDLPLIVQDNHYPFETQATVVNQVKVQVDDMTFVKHILYMHAILDKLPNLEFVDGNHITSAAIKKNDRQYRHVKKFMSK